MSTSMEELLRKSVEVTPTGSIKFFSSNKELKNEANDENKNSRNTVSFETSSHSECARLSRATSSVSSVGHAQVIENWINQRSLKRIQERHSAESFKTRQMYMTVLNNEETFVKDIEDFIKDHEMLNLRRKELQHRRWHESVYEPLRRQVEHTIESDYDGLDVQKRKAYLNYLSHVNTKGDVFLDVIAEDEYDPLKLLHRDSPVRLTAKTPKLIDPLLSQERQRIEECKTSLRCVTGKKASDHEITNTWLPSPPLVPLGRHGTQCSTWLAMPLQQIESPVRVRSRRRMKSSFNSDSFDFGTWRDFKTADQQSVEKELKLQKKKRFPIPTTFSKEKHWIEFPHDKVQRVTKPHVKFTLPEASLPPITSES